MNHDEMIKSIEASRQNKEFIRISLADLKKTFEVEAEHIRVFTAQTLSYYETEAARATEYEGKMLDTLSERIALVDNLDKLIAGEVPDIRTYEPEESTIIPNELKRNPFTKRLLKG